MVALSGGTRLEYAGLELDSLILVALVGFWSGSKTLWQCLGFIDKVAVIATVRFQVRSGR